MKMKKPWLLYRAISETLTLTLGRSHFPSLRRSFSSATSSISVNKVTISNFESALEDLRLHVRDADFVSVDLEMTGVTSAPWRESFEFDRFDVRYLKVKDSAEKFAVVQFGVCPFRWDGLKESFVAHPHNFYIFPRKELPVDGSSYEFLCQTTSIDFLAKHQFDFNAWIHEGISYLSRAQEAEALRSVGLAYEDEFVNSQCDSKDVREVPLVSTADILFSERMKNRFREWRDQLLQGATEGCQFERTSDESKQQLQTIFFKMRPALMLNNFTSHQLTLIRQVLGKHFEDLSYVRVNGEHSSEQKLVVYADTEDDKALLMKEVKEDVRKETEVKIKTAVGFRHVIELLASEQKLIVGHNCFLDLAHIYSKFFGPLPSSVAEFASSVHKLFPCIIDTKHLLKADSLLQHLMKRNSTSLSSAFALLCPQIVCPSNNYSLASRPCVKVEVQADEMRSSSWNSGLVKNELLQKHINLLYLGWNSGTIIDLKTGSEILEFGFQNHKRRYPKIVFENIVIIWGFPYKFKPRELRDCICKVFGQDSVTSIYYLDKTAAFIQFSKQEFTTDFLVLKDSLEKRNDAISVLHPLAKLLDGGKTCAANYDVYKKICSSPISRFLFADQAKAVGIRWKTDVELGEETETQETESGRESESESIDRGKKGTVKYHSFSCGRVLDTLYVSGSLLGNKQEAREKL
ncbi:polynucleotidyl transferase, ribonuclease H-like superfamily protein isoform X2 [Tasmannia lanceolata]|uniref:polynucleotidyl transferase, ribonuclease H-like superfamily protein isoform X2 n=1 Tax=Tasmannia lanceolata TaxID=3420 RepID=UPI004064553D